MTKTLLTFMGIMICASAMAEMHVWTFNDGKSIEAEFMAYTGGQVSLKTIKGKLLKIPVSKFGADDLRYMELLNPPRLEVDFTRKTSQRLYPPTYNNNELPRQTLYSFICSVKQVSSTVYRQGLTVELFVIGTENAGDKNLLYHYQKEDFNLDGRGSLFELKSKEIKVTEYVLNGQLRGDAYKGYMIVVTDSQGEVIASKSTRSEWLEIADNLRKLPVGKTFDENGERCWPTRPKRYY